MATLAAVLIAAAPAGATFHEIKIRAIHPSNSVTPGQAAWVELQMFASGQTQLSGHYLRTYLADGSENTTFLFPGDVSQGDNQRTILVGKETLAGGTTSDFQGGSNLMLTGGGGAVCYLDTIGPPAVYLDCVSYGNFTGSTLVTPLPAGTPAATTNFGDTLVRTITPNCPTFLEGADDTNNSAADFAIDNTFSPRNNSAAPTEVPCPQPPGAPTLNSTFNLQAAIKKCKRKFPKGPKRKNCVRKAKHRAQA